MARIAFVSQPRDAISATDNQDGSVAIVLWELAKRIGQRHDVVILAPRAAGQPLESLHDGLRIVRVPHVFRSLHKALDLATGACNFRTPYFATRLSFREYGLSVARYLRAERPDIVHLQNLSQFAPLFRAAVPDAQIFLQVHDEFLSLLPDDMVRKRMQHVNAVVTCSDFVTRGLQTRLPHLADRIHTVGNGVDCAFFQSRRHPTDPRRFRILYVGRVSPEKGVHTLAAAFGALALRDERVELDIAGSAGLLPFNQVRLLSGDPQVAALGEFYGATLWSRANKQLLHARTSYWRSIEMHIPSSVRNRVNVFGQLSREALRSAYGRAHVLVMPSICMEPFGLPIVEAMASGLPCIASRAGGMPDIVEEHVTGLLVERGETSALAAAIRRLSLDPAACEIMGRAGRNRAEKCFEWSSAVARLDFLYCKYLQASVTARQPGRTTPLSVP